MMKTEMETNDLKPKPGMDTNVHLRSSPHDHMYPQAQPTYQLGYPYSSFHGNYPIQQNNPYNNNPPLYYNNNYYQQPYYDPPGLRIQEPDPESTSFARTMLILMLVLVGSMCIMTLGMWYLYGTYVPEFEVGSMKVSNFTATNDTLTGTWNADIIIGNPNQHLAIEFQRVRYLVYYRGMVIGSSSMDSFKIEKDAKLDLNISMVADDRTLIKTGTLHDWLLPSLAGDWSKGEVVFSLRLAMVAKLWSPNHVYRHDSLTVSCDDLQVSFTSDVYDGVLSQGSGTQCLIHLQDYVVCMLNDHLI